MSNESNPLVSPKTSANNDPTIDSLVYVGFNSKVVALDRYTGELIWQWESPKGTGYPALLLDGDRLIVSVNGYTYCLDPIFGQEVWANHLTGLGVGIANICSVRGNSAAASNAQSAAVAVKQQQDAQAAAS